MPRIHEKSGRPSTKKHDDKSIFTSLEFKRLLRDTGTEIKALRKFCKACGHHEAAKNSTYDIVKAYITVSPECAEITNILEQGKRSLVELAAVFECVLNVLVRTAGDLKETFPDVGYIISNLILRHHTQKLYQCLEDPWKSKTTALIIRLLTAMVMQSKSTAWLVASQVDLSLQCFKHILKVKEGMKKLSQNHVLRVAYIRFALSFFLSGDMKTTQRVLETRGFVSSIFRGLTEDPASMIVLFLTTLRDKVIKNLSVPKTAKVRLLSEPGVLLSTAALFNWKGIMDVGAAEGDVDCGDQEVVSRLAYDFLFHACCPFKYGINFKDKTFGTTGKSRNHVLLRFINSLSSAVTNKVVGDLVVQILKACPDLLSSYLANFQNLVSDPKPTVKWMSYCDFINQIYNAQPDVAPAIIEASRCHSHGDDNLDNAEALVKAATPGIFPAILTKTFQRRCLTHTSWKVREKVLEMLLLALHKASSSFDFIGNPENWSKSCHKVWDFQAHLSSLKDTITEAYLNLPQITMAWSECSKEDVCESLHAKKLFIHVLCKCHQNFAESMPQTNFDPVKLLSGAGANSSIEKYEETKAKLPMHDEDTTLSLLRLLVQHPQKHKWFKMVERGQSPFYKLLHIICQAKNSANQNPPVYSEAVTLLKKILVANDVLDEHDVCETDIWVEYLPISMTTGPTMDTEMILKYLQDVCGSVVRQPCRYSSLLETSSQTHAGWALADDPSVTPHAANQWWNSVPCISIDVIKFSTPSTGLLGVQGSGIGSTPNVPSKLMSLLVVASLNYVKLDDCSSASKKKIIDRYLVSVVDRIFHASCSADKAASFVKAFRVICEAIDFGDNYPLLGNFASFLSLWDGACTQWSEASAGTFDAHHHIKAWFWNAFTSGTPADHLLGPGQLDILKGLIDITSLNNSGERQGNTVPSSVRDMLWQLVLYFDTSTSTWDGKLRDSAAGLKILDLVHWLLQESLTAASKSVRGVMNDRHRSTFKFNDDSDVRDLAMIFLENGFVKGVFFDATTSYQSPNDLVSFSLLRKKCASVTVEVLLKVLSLFPDCRDTDLFKHYFCAISKAVINMLELLVVQNEDVAVKPPRVEAISAFTSLHTCLPLRELEIILRKLGVVFSHVTNMTGLLESCCKVLVECLTAISQDSNADMEVKIDHGTANAIFDFLITKCPERLYEKLILALAMLLEMHVIPTLIVPVSVVEFCWANATHNSLRLLLNVFKQVPNLALHLCKSLQKGSMKMPDADEGMKKFIPVVVYLLDYCKLLCDNNVCDGKENFYQDFNRSVMMTCCSMMFENCGSDEAKKKRELSFILSSSGGGRFMRHFLTLLKSVNGDSSVRMLLDVVISESCVGTLEEKLFVLSVAKNISESDEKHGEWKSEVILLCMTQAMSKVSENDWHYSLATLNDAACGLEDGDFGITAKNVSWQWNEFVKQMLRHHFSDPLVLTAITKLLPVIYTEQGLIRCTDKSDKSEVVVIEVAVLRMLVTSHSQFLQIMFGETDHSDTNGYAATGNEELVKDHLTELYYELCVRCDPTMLSEKDLVGLLLGAYECTLSFSDQNILKILASFEQRGILSSDLKPFLWGRKAAHSFHTRRKLGNALWRKPNSNEILACIDDSVMDATLKRFPLRRQIICTSNGTSGLEHFENDSNSMISPAEDKIAEAVRKSQHVYDPSFLLPALLDLLAPENALDCRHFIRCKALSFLFACLASHCSTTRCLSTACLNRFYVHCESSWFPEKNLATYLICAVRNGICVKEQKLDSVSVTRVPSVVANFLSSVAELYQTPSYHMYSVLHRFILVKPQLDLTIIPEFFVLFFSADLEYKVERSWILNLIADGLRDTGDFHAVNSRNVFKLIMCCHDSPISDNFTRRQIYQIFELACRIRGVAFQLVKTNGLMAWLTAALCLQPLAQSVEIAGKFSFNPAKRQENTMHILKVLHSLWMSLNLKRVSREGSEEEWNALGNVKNLKRVPQNANVSDASEDEVIQGLRRDFAKRSWKLIPFRILKQIFKLGMLVLRNLLRMYSKRSTSYRGAESLKVVDAFCVTIDILNSSMNCIRQRRKKFKLRKVDGCVSSLLEKNGDLQSSEAETLIRVAMVLDTVHVPDTLQCIAEVLISWTPSSDGTVDVDLVMKSMMWALNQPFKICLQGPASEGGYLKEALHWIACWFPVIGTNDIECIKQQLLRCYSEVSRSLTFSDNSSVVLIECIHIMNMLMERLHGTEDHQSEFLCVNTLLKMQSIRQRTAAK